MMWYFIWQNTAAASDLALKGAPLSSVCVRVWVDFTVQGAESHTYISAGNYT